MAAVGLSLAAISAYAGLRKTSTAAPGHAADVLYERALTGLTNHDIGAYIDGLARVWRADPAYLRAHLDAAVFLAGMRPARVFAIWDSAAARVTDPALRTCLHRLMALRRSMPTRLSGTRSVKRPADACNVLADLERGYNRIPDTTQIRLAAELAAFPGAGDGVATVYLGKLAAHGQYRRLVVECRVFLASERSEYGRAYVYGYLIGALHKLGDHEAAYRAEKAALRFAERGPGIMANIGSSLMSHREETVLARGRSTMDSAEHIRQIALIGDSLAARAARVDDYGLLNWYLGVSEKRLDTGRLDESLVHFDSALLLARKLHDTVALQRIHMRRGRALVKLARPAEAERELLTARSFGRTLDAVGLLEVEHNLLHLYEARDPLRAEEAGRAFVEHGLAVGTPALQIVSYRDFGLFRLRQGRPSEALPLFHEMIRRIKEEKIEHAWAGEFYELIGQLDSAAHYYELEWKMGSAPMRSLGGLIRLAQAKSDHARAVEYATFHDQFLTTQRNPERVPLLPSTYARAGRIDEAIRGYQHARRDARQSGRVAGWATLSTDLAELLLERNARLAGHIADSAAAAAREVGLTDVQLRAIGLRETGWLKVRQGSPHSHVARIAQARAAAQQRGLLALATELQTLEGKAWSTLGQLDQALRAFQQADETTSEIAHSLAVDASRAGYRANRIQISNHALQAIVASHHPQRIERYSQWLNRRKARGLNDLLGATGLPTVSRLRHALSAAEAIVDFTVLDSAVVALVITRKAAQLIRLDVTPALLAPRIQQHQSSRAAAVGSQVDLTRSAVDTANAHVLWQTLFEPLTAALAGAQRLYVIPDGDLHRIAFDALITKPARRPRYMLDDYEIVLAPSHNRLAERSSRLEVRGVLVVTAANAPAADREAQYIAAELPERTRISKAIDASLANYDVVHFAVHARPNEREPAYARLELEQGALYAADVAKFGFANKLVVLSACETAQGRLLSGEGVLNLSRTFLAAGAISTVSTLWPIGAPTADFMQQFYGELARQRSVSAALRSAKLYFRRSSEFSNPYYWAPFTLVTPTLQPLL